MVLPLVVIGEVGKYTENTTARGHFTDRLKDFYYYGSMSDSVEWAYHRIFGEPSELGKKLEG